MSPSKAQLNTTPGSSPPTRKAMTAKLRGVLAGLSGATYVPSQARDAESPQPKRTGSRGLGEQLRSHEPYLI